MEHLYKTQEAELEDKFLPKTFDAYQGWKIEDVEEVKVEFKFHTINLFKRFKEILEGEKIATTVGIGLDEEDYYYNKGLDTAIAEVENFIKSLEK